MVKDLPTIRRTYLKGWFMIDLISIVPFKYIPGGEGLSILRIVRIIRLLKLLRVLKASNIYKQYESQISLPHSIVTLVKFTALMMILLGTKHHSWAQAEHIEPLSGSVP